MAHAGLSVEHLSKSYKGVYALKSASLHFRPGEIHALLGENGAGKSTLCKILSGAITPDAGVIRVGDAEFGGLTPGAAKSLGIEMIYQEFNLVPEMSVYENVFLGKELRNGLLLRRGEMIERTRRLFDQLGISVDPAEKIERLSVAYCQLVEIAKSVMEEAKILIMDEPTAPLTATEVDNLLRLVRDLRAKGVTIVYISHRIEELLELTDRITVMRDGEIIKTLDTKDTNRPELIRLMVGRELGTDFPPIADDGKQGEELLRVSGLCTPVIRNVSFTLHRGEILGLTGLVGAGRTETVRAIFGADPVLSGSVFIKGEAVHIRSPREAIRRGLAMLPEDRKRQGVHLELPINLNVSLIKIRELSRFFTVLRNREKELVRSFINTLSIKLASVKNLVSSLSGGNQQKVALSKWLSTGADILFFDEPTRGIDVGAKKEIYDLMDALRKKGKGIVMISSEMQESIGMCNRVIVMCQGRIEGELPASGMTQERILEFASGNSGHHDSGVDA